MEESVLNQFLVLDYLHIYIVHVNAIEIRIHDSDYNYYLDGGGSQRVFLKTEDWPYLGDF